MSTPQKTKNSTLLSGCQMFTYYSIAVSSCVLVVIPWISVDHLPNSDDSLDLQHYSFTLTQMSTLFHNNGHLNDVTNTLIGLSTWLSFLCFFLFLTYAVFGKNLIALIIVSVLDLCSCIALLGVSGGYYSTIIEAIAPAYVGVDVYIEMYTPIGIIGTILGFILLSIILLCIPNNDHNYIQLTNK